MFTRTYERLRWTLRRIIPVALNDNQAALLDAVLIHEQIGGGEREVLLEKIGTQLGASDRDRRVVGFVLGVST